MGPGSDPIGRSFVVEPRRRVDDQGNRLAPRTLQVVGVAEDGRYVDFDDQPAPYFWTSIEQDYAPTAVILAQGYRNTQEAVAALSELVVPAPGELQRVRPSPLADHVSIQFVHLRIASTLLGAAGVFGLLLAAVGVYGMVAFAAARRAREMAVRMAVGAGRGQVFRHISGEGLRLAAIGLLVGFGVAIPGAYALRGVLVDVGALDPPFPLEWRSRPAAGGIHRQLGGPP